MNESDGICKQHGQLWCRACSSAGKEIARLKDSLSRLEWCVQRELGGITLWCCPACQRSQEGGHVRQCWLADVLHGPVSSATE